MAVGTITDVSAGPQGTSVPVNLGALKLTVNTVVGSASYTTGGDSLTAAQLGLGTVLFAICETTGSAANNAAIGASYIPSTGKLQMWSGATQAETGTTTNVSGVTVTVYAFGY